MKLLALYVVVAGLLLCNATNGFAHTPRLENKLLADSTLFSLKLEPGSAVTAGKTFKVKIHVMQRSGYRIFSSTMDPDGGVAPLALAIPSELSGYFRLVQFREIGKIQEKYDSNFLALNKSHPAPFDIVATIKVLHSSHRAVPFHLWLRYMCCDSMYCYPPRWFDVPMSILGKKPIEVRIADAMEQNRSLFTYAMYRNLG